MIKSRNEALQNAKNVVRTYYRALDRASYDELDPLLSLHCHSEMIWRGFHPFNEIRGAKNVSAQFWKPLKQSMSGLRRRLDLFMAGSNTLDEASSIWVASMGHLMGLFDQPWLCIKPSGKIVMLRYGAFHKVEGDQITETAMFFDIPHLMAQANQNPFPNQTAVHLVQPGPEGHNGLLFEPQDPHEGQKTQAAIDYMINDIKNWTGGRQEPLVDELRRSWNEDMIWWGPTGIGATYTIERYAKQHSGPFREAFSERIFNGHITRISEGHFGGFFGWPNLTLTMTGPFMGRPATGKTGDMRVIDFYRREGNKLTENWIFIDLLHFWKQQGIDILAGEKL